MAFEIPLFDLGVLVAAADLSSSQFLAMYVDTNGKIAKQTGSGGLVVGVLQNKPTAGQTATVRTAGVTKWQAGGSINAGVAVTVDAAGKCIAAGTGNRIAGFALTSAASGDDVSVLLTGGTAAD